MTPDYSTLDTAALVAAAEALTADVKAGEWQRINDGSIVSSHGEYVVHVNRYGVLKIDDADAAFIAAAPALVKALVARLRECGKWEIPELDEEDMPELPKFVVGGKARINSFDNKKMNDYFAHGTVVTVLSRHYDPLGDSWSYTVTDGQVTCERLHSVYLEPATNG